MPEPGFQHKTGGLASINPFASEQLAISPYTIAEAQHLQSLLDKRLGPEYISTRSGPGGLRVHYLAAEKAINLANEVFGFNGWSSAIQNIQVDFVEESPSGKVSLGLSVIVRVTLKDGTYHEDIGYGHMENANGKAQAFEKAKKEGTTDALKRVLRNFGNVLGNCIYDKNYLKEVTKMRIPHTKLSPDILYRHNDFVPKTKQTNHAGSYIGAPLAKEEPKSDDSASTASKFEEVMEEFRSDDFDDLLVEGEFLEDVRPDDVAVDSISLSLNLSPPPNELKGSASVEIHGRNNPPSIASMVGPGDIARGSVPSGQKPFVRNHHAQSNNSQTSTPKLGVSSRMHSSNQANQYPRPPINQSVSSEHSRGMPPPPARGHGSEHSGNGQNFQSNPQTPQSQRAPTPQQCVPVIQAPRLQQVQALLCDELTGPPSVGFFSARAAETVQNDGKLVPEQGVAFNPHQRTSIPRTGGIDHSKSSPVQRKVLGNKDPRPGPSRINLENPSLTAGRQIGMPLQSAPQLHQITPFKAPRISPPQANQGVAGIKRPAENNAEIGQTALGDASNAYLSTQYSAKQSQINRNDHKRIRPAD